MASLQDLLRAALSEDSDRKESFDEMKKLHEATFGKVRTRYVYNAAIEWTMHEVFTYAMNVIGTKEERHEEARKVARLVGELRDTLIGCSEYNSTRMPNIDYFQALNAVKEPG